MRPLKSSSLVLLVALAGCSGLDTKNSHIADTNLPARHIAQVNEVIDNRLAMKAKIDTLMNGIFQSYMLGQVYLADFDRELDKNPGQALKSEAYNSLLAIRNLVDEYEHQVNDLYVSLVLVSAYPEYSQEQKENARWALKALGNYADGIKSDNTRLPENLKPLVLSNLREKQSQLFDELKTYRDREEGETRDIIHKEMVNLRATRMSYFKELKNYKVDNKLLEKVLKEEKKKKSFRQLEGEINDLKSKMKEFMADIGRSTSSDVIEPSTAPNGKINGSSWPAKTWSLTYDDGPVAGTTETILKNLQERNIPATFFMCANKLNSYTSVGLKIKAAGMDLANHSYTHALLTKVGPAELEKQIGESKRVIESKLDTKVKLFRLPYGAGANVSTIRAKIAQHNMIHVAWTVDTLDWQDKNPQSILARTLKQMKASSKNSGIVLFHDIHQQSVIASTLLMDHFNKEKLTVCTVQAVVDQINQNLPSCK